LRSAAVREAITSSETTRSPGVTVREITAAASGSAACSASTEPMWSPWAWVRSIVVIGFPASWAAAARIAFELRGIIVSITVSRSSSSTR
jgi:hypothetical protein